MRRTRNARATPSRSSPTFADPGSRASCRLGACARSRHYHIISFALPLRHARRDSVPKCLQNGLAATEPGAGGRRRGRGLPYWQDSACSAFS